MGSCPDTDIDPLSLIEAPLFQATLPFFVALPLPDPPPPRAPIKLQLHCRGQAIFPVFS